MAEAPLERSGIHRRHERKDEFGELSQEGYEEALNDAQAMFEQIVLAQPGTVFSITSSNIGRSLETARTIEREIKRLVFARRKAGLHDVLALSSRRDGPDAIKKRTQDKTRKYIILDTEPDPELGYGSHDNEFNKKAYNETLQFLNNDEELIAYLWAVQPEELNGPGGLREYFYERIISSRRDSLSEEEIADIESRFEEMTDPRKFAYYTPEDLAIHHLKAYQSHFKNMDEMFPENPTVSTFIGHAPGCDFVAMALLGQKISWSSYKAIDGYRDFFEPHSFSVVDGEVVFADFRSNRSSIVPIKIADVITQLEKESNERKEAWAQFGN